MKKQYPVRGQVYTLETILNVLELRDSPSLSIPVARDPDVEFDTAPIQDSHLTYDELLAVPHAPDSQWRFVCETNEWIPIFDFVGSAEDALAFCDVVKVWDSAYERHAWWVTPKGHPRDYPREFV